MANSAREMYETCIFAGRVAWVLGNKREYRWSENQMKEWLASGRKGYNGIYVGDVG
jgi:hypothetical protein